MKRVQRIGIALIVIFVYLGNLTPLVSSVSAVGVVLPTTADGVNSNIHYFVGLGYHDIWRRTNLEWTSDGFPGGPASPEFPYEFHFPNRVIKSVQVEAFVYDTLNTRVNVIDDTNHDGQKNIKDIFYESRYLRMEYDDFRFRV